jgi:hypothetical protein
MSQNIDYRRVRQYVDEHLGKQKNFTQVAFFLVSLAMFVGFNVIAWAGLGLSEVRNEAIGGGIMLSVGWGVSLMYQFVLLLLNSKVGERRLRESLTLRGIQREMARLGMSDLAELDVSEKPKRQSGLRLSDDGELIAATDAEPQHDSAANAHR